MTELQDNHGQNHQVLIRSYKHGDEDKIVDLLNHCFPEGWGNKQKWEWQYPQAPSFESSNIFIVEKNSQIVGHRGSHHRWLVIRGREIPVVFLGDTAIHPKSRKLRLYSSLHNTTLEAAGNRGACLALTANSRGSITYHHNKRTGFVEIKRNPTYVKALNHSTVFKEEVSAVISRRERLKFLFGSLETKLYIQFDGTIFPIRELIDSSDSTAPLGNKKDMTGIILAKDSLPLLIGFVAGGKFEKMKCLICLLLGGKVKMKMKVKFASFITLGNIAWTGIRMIRHV